MKPVILFFLALCIGTGLSAQPPVDEAKKAAMQDSLAKDPVLFLKLATKQLKWEEPARPVPIAGPVYFVGTKGLASYLIKTSQGLIVLYSGMPSSGPMIEKSIRELGFNPKDIKLLLTGHAHTDHAGGLNYLQKISGAKMAIMDKELALLESGGKADFHYGAYPVYYYPGVKADRVLHDNEDVTLGDIKLTALFTGGHTRGGTSWVMHITDQGKKYTIVFPDGISINPGYRLAVNPSYPGIKENYLHSLDVLEKLQPDIWLPSHTDFFDLEGKSKKKMPSGGNAFVDPEGYKKYIAAARATYEKTIAKEMAAQKK